MLLAQITVAISLEAPTRYNMAHAMAVVEGVTDNERKPIWFRVASNNTWITYMGDKGTLYVGTHAARFVAWNNPPIDIGELADIL